MDSSSLSHVYKSKSIRFSENEFTTFLENEIIVVPQARLPEISLFGGKKYGPFRSSEPVSIPLWIAQEFDRHGWIRIEMLPSWMESLPAIIEEEKKNKNSLYPLPFDYVVIGRWICDHLRRHDSSGTESSKYTALLRDLEDIRNIKMFGKESQSLQQLLSFNDGFRFGSLDRMEINTKRNLITDSLRLLSEFDDNAEAEA